MILKKLSLFILFLAFASCSNLQEQEKPQFDRMPAEAASSCQDLVKNLFMKDNYKEDLNKALYDKKLLKFSNKFVTVQHPNLDWINKTRIALNRSLKNWNNHKYPAFYIFNDEEVVVQAKRYFETINSMVTKGITPRADASKNLDVVSGWMKSFENYPKDINNLLEERISLQYNLNILKKFKQTEDIQDIKIVIKRDGKFIDEIVTLRRSDKDKNALIARLKGEIKALDGDLLHNGRIKDRIIRQAALNDMLTITHREFEHGLKNTAVPHEELGLELTRINTLLAKAELKPTTYGVYRVTNKVFIKETLAATKIDYVYKRFIDTPAMKFKEIIDAYIKKKNNLTEVEKVGIFKRIYLKVTNLTPKQIAIGSGSVVVAGIGYERYFAVKDQPDINEQISGNLEIRDVKEIDDKKHQEQLERTQKEDAKRTDEHTEVVEVELEDFINS